MTVERLFVIEVRSWLPPIPNEDSDSVDRGIAQLFEMGFSINDAVAYTRCTEEVNPELEEEPALAKMKEIGSKYPKYLDRCKIFQKPDNERSESVEGFIPDLPEDKDFDQI